MRVARRQATHQVARGRAGSRQAGRVVLSEWLVACESDDAMDGITSSKRAVCRWANKSETVEFRQIKNICLQKGTFWVRLRSSEE
jgi:hypothetical protein